MKEAVINLSEKIAGLEFDQPALKASFAQMGKPVKPEFVDAMRRTLGQYAEVYRNDLAARELHKVRVEDIERLPDRPARTILLWEKHFAETNRANLAATRKAFELLVQDKAVLDVEVAVASNYIMQDLGNK